MIGGASSLVFRRPEGARRRHIPRYEVHIFPRKRLTSLVDLDVLVGRGNIHSDPQNTPDLPQSVVSNAD